MFKKSENTDSVASLKSEFDNFTEDDWKEFFEVKKTDNTESN